MSLFPKITSPCPYKGSLSDILDGDICRLCKKEVFDLSALDDGERQALVASCPDELCVSYRVGAKSAIAAMALGAAALSVPVAAQDSEADAEASEDVFYIIVGGLPGKDKVEWVADAPEFSPPPIPVVYEDETQPAAEPEAAPDTDVSGDKPTGASST